MKEIRNLVPLSGHPVIVLCVFIKQIATNDDESKAITEQLSEQQTMEGQSENWINSRLSKL